MPGAVAALPELAVTALVEPYGSRFARLIEASELTLFDRELEVWTSNASNRALSYLSHGLFRYFGKFPPPIARYLIQTYTDAGGLVVDPMCGSGTTALESTLLGRRALCMDVNPLSVLLSRVKVTRIDRDEYRRQLRRLADQLEGYEPTERSVLLPGIRDPEHWFLPKTMDSLSAIGQAIAELPTSAAIREALTIARLAIVRRVSRATTQQGRLFLDVATAEENAIPFFLDKAASYEERLAALPEVNEVRVELGSAVNADFGVAADLIICHPPYFNSYKYSGVMSLELAWLHLDHAQVRKNEVREAFKVGKAEKVEDYLADMERVLRNLVRGLRPGGRLALMIGDTVMKGQYIPVTARLLRRVEDILKVERMALRVPQFTEASWAASQRRKGGEVGINLCDFVVTLGKL